MHIDLDEYVEKKTTRKLRIFGHDKEAVEMTKFDKAVGEMTLYYAHTYPRCG
jgi:hypothetical protein